MKTIKQILNVSFLGTKFFRMISIIAAFLFTAAQAQTFKAVPLDGGGWISGFCQANNGRIYAYGDVFGAWRTDNGGTNWTYLNWSIPDGDIVGYGMAVQKDNADVVYYSTNTSLWKSTNGGSSWTKILTCGSSLPRFRGSSPILIRSNNSSEIWFAGTRSGQTGWLWRSQDGGTNWTKMGGTSFDSNRARTLHNISQYSSQIWVGADDGLWVSTNGGTSFTKINGPTEVGMIQRFPSGTYAGIGLVTRSNNNGGISRITASDFNNAATYTATESGTVNLYFGYPTGLQIFSDGTCSAWNTSADRHGFSNNGGVTFTTRATTLNTTNVPVWTTAAIMTSKNKPDDGSDQVIEDVTNANKWIITGGGAAMYSMDKGLSWQYFPNNSGIAAVKTYLAGVSRHDVNRIYIPASDIGSAIVTDGGSSGNATRSSCKFYTSLHGSFRIMEGPDANNLVLAGVSQGESRNIIMKSSDGGANWTEFNLSGSGLPASTDGISKSVMSLNSSSEFVVVLSEIGSPAQRVYRTTNGGSSFSVVSGLPDNMSTGARYNPQNSFIERDATINNVLYFTARNHNLFKSTNGGANWSAITHPFGVNEYVWGLHADPIRSNNLWAAGAGHGIKVSRDGGSTWTSTAQYFDSKYVSSCDGKIAVWGKKDGGSNPELLWYSSDDGATWTAQTSASNNFHGVQGLTVDRNGKIWVSWNSCTMVTPTSSNVAVTGVSLSPTSVSVAVGATSTLTATVAPSNATNKTVSWSSNNTSVATVNSSGVVTGVAAGSATITVTTQDGAKTATCAVTVTSSQNLGFENSFTGWSTYGTASINTSNFHSGTKSGYFSNGGGNYVYTGLTPGATYVVRGWVKAVSGTEIWITVNTYGGSQVGAQLTSTSWTQSGDIVFTMGASNTSATISTWTGSTSSAYFDDFTLALYSTNSVTYVTDDKTTKGEWKTKSGADGYTVYGYATSLPSYATITYTGTADWTWASSTTDVRAMEKATTSDRVAATKYSSGTDMTINVNVTGGVAKDVYFYILDWDNQDRRMTVEAKIGSTVIHTYNVNANFSGGWYIKYSVKGSIDFKFTKTAGSNAVVSGILFGSNLKSASDTEAKEETTNISNNTNTQTLIYPNPANNVLHLANIAPNANINIYSIEGKLVKNINQINGNQTTIDVSNWNKGVYFVTVNSQFGNQTSKLVVK